MAEIEGFKRGCYDGERLGFVAGVRTAQFEMAGLLIAGVLAGAFAGVGIVSERHSTALIGLAIAGAAYWFVSRGLENRVKQAQHGNFLAEKAELEFLWAEVMPRHERFKNFVP